MLSDLITKLFAEELIMNNKAKKSFGASLSRLAPSIIFPSIFFGLIFWDWNNTRVFKENQKQLKLLQETEKN